MCDISIISLKYNVEKAWKYLLLVFPSILQISNSTSCETCDGSQIHDRFSSISTCRILEIRPHHGSYIKIKDSFGSDCKF